MIYYLGYYTCEKIDAEKRIAAPPAVNKMGYIISTLSEFSDMKTVVVSPSETRLHSYVRGTLHDLNARVSLKTFDSFRGKNKIIRGLGHLWTKFQLMHFLMTHVKSDDTIIVYHSLFLMHVVKKVKKKKKCRLIIEVEELYSDVREDLALRKKEVDYLQCADKYIVITELLNKQVNLQHKPNIISHGTYSMVPKYAEKVNDGKVHIVYAGTFNPVKGGVYSAIESAEFLDENFVLHILGQGSVADTEAVIKKIEEVSAKSKCQIIYDGYKTGKEFNMFIQSCHIGLSTQQPNGKYNASSFPSKVLMYMSNDLQVISVRIPAIESSDVGEYIYYYDSSTPQNIAEVIKSVPKFNSFNVREKLNELDNKFKEELSILLI